MIAGAISDSDRGVALGIAATPIVRWVGSKQNLLPVLIPIVRKVLAMGTGRLIEPFAGSGALTLAIAPATGVLSDACVPLMQIHEMIKVDAALIYSEILSIAREYGSGDAAYMRARRVFNKGSAIKVMQAALLIYLNRTGFNALYRVNSKGQFNVPFGKRTPQWPTLADLQACARALRNVEITSGDWIEVLDRTGIQAGDTIYCDPPYEGTFDGYGEKWSKDQHDAMADLLRNIAADRVRVVVSQPDTPEARARYRWAEMHEVARIDGYAVGGTKAKRSARGELIFVGGTV
mgnify:FL=1